LIRALRSTEQFRAIELRAIELKKEDS